MAWAFFLFAPLPIVATVYEVNSTTELRQALEDAAHNGQNDTIKLAPGIYQTTADDGGTFTFNDQEEYNLTIIGTGKNMDATTLDGNDSTQVLNFNNSKPFTLTLKNLAIVHGKTNGNTGHGAGFFVNSNYDVHIRLILQDCNVSYNSASGNGGGFYIKNSDINISDSHIMHNKTHYHGGGFWAGRLTLKNSIVSYNDGNYSGGGFSVDQATIYDSTISHNISGGRGGGFESGTTSIFDSNITHNSTSGDGGGFIAGNTYLSNALLAQNSAYKGGALAVSNLTMVNSKIANNRAIYEGGGCKITRNAILINSIFISNAAKNNSGAIKSNRKIIAFNNDFIENSPASQEYGIFVNNIFEKDGIAFNGDSYLYGNYIDRKNIDGDNAHNVMKISNIQPSDSDTLFMEDNITLAENAPVIDQGINPDSDLIQKLFKDDNTTYMTILDHLKTDYFGNERIVNGIIDMGATEYGAKPYHSDKPEIDIKISGDQKVYHPIDINFTIQSKYPIKELEIDKGNGFETVDSTLRSFKITFNEAGEHTIKIKVVDDQGNSTEIAKTIQIYDLTTQEAIEYGKQLCQKDPASCGIAQNTQPSTILDNPKLTQASRGWSLLGTNQHIDADQIFDKNPKVTVIWKYVDGQWLGIGKSETINHSLQTSSIPLLQTLEEGDGFWIYVKP